MVSVPENIPNVAQDVAPSEVIFDSPPGREVIFVGKLPLINVCKSPLILFHQLDLEWLELVRFLTYFLLVLVVEGLVQHLSRNSSTWTRNASISSLPVVRNLTLRTIELGEGNFQCIS